MGATTLDALADKLGVYNASEGRIDEAVIDEVLKFSPIIFPLGGQFMLDPNEFNGWGVIGPYDNSNNQDLGNVGVANPSRIAGGVVYPFDVQLKRFYAWHQNNNAAAQAWGWRIGRQQKTDAANTVTWNSILDEVGDNGGTGPRDYLNTTTQLTDLDLSASAIIPAGETIVMGVESPTAVATNYWVRIMSGYFEFQRA